MLLRLDIRDCLKCPLVLLSVEKAGSGFDELPAGKAIR
jgi:hypothetical protein